MLNNRWKMHNAIKLQYITYLLYKECGIVRCMKSTHCKMHEVALKVLSFVIHWHSPGNSTPLCGYIFPGGRVTQQSFVARSHASLVTLEQDRVVVAAKSLWSVNAKSWPMERVAQPSICSSWSKGPQLVGISWLTAAWRLQTVLGATSAFHLLELYCVLRQ